MKLNKLTKFIISILVPLSAGFIGSKAMVPSIDGWYRTIEKSSLTPSDFVFGPVWTLLYLSMGIAFFWIWTSNTSAKNFRFVSLVYFLQVAVNGFWSYAFFALESPATALVVIVTLWLLIVITMVNFYRIDKKAGLILIPYLAWVSFATYLNFMVWYLN